MSIEIGYYVEPGSMALRGESVGFEAWRAGLYALARLWRVSHDRFDVRRGHTCIVPTLCLVSSAKQLQDVCHYCQHLSRHRTYHSVVPSSLSPVSSRDSPPESLILLELS